MNASHLLSVQDLSKLEAFEILDTARQLSRITDGAIKKLPTLRGRTVVNLFFEDSTRTRLSFEAAAKRLSAEVINFSAKGSSVSKGESLKDTAQTLEAMGAELMIIRHSSSGAAQRLAESGWVRSHIVNAGDGMHEHPTQALLDAFTIREHFPDHDRDFTGLRVGIVGDILHSRVARSNALLLTSLGAQVVLIAPPTLIPIGVETWPVEISYHLDSQISSLDAIMMLRVQSERMNVLDL
jgi:aspartate carbamoyltransferase catalytic subunit